MARIETYPLDGNISVNDYVIGTDGDSLNATKNYKVLTFLDYLGTMYNLNSTDLLFNYNDVAAGSVANGQVSTNNFADGTILMSGVTNIYVSKITAFGQLVDNIIDTIGTEGLTIMFTDMGNRNNLGIFTVVSTADVDANTINMTVTASTAVGSIDAGKVMGIRIGIGGGGGGTISDIAYDATTWDSNLDGASKNAIRDKMETMMTLDTVQVVSAIKGFQGGGANALQVGVNVEFGLSVGSNVSATNGYLQILPAQAGSFDTSWNPNSFQGTKNQFRIGVNNGDWILQGGGDGTATIVPYTRLDQSNYTGSRTHTWQDKNGTIAHLADLPSLFSEAELTSYTTTGATSETASTISIPADTLINDGDILEYSYVFQSTGVTNSNNLTVNVNFASTGHNLNGLTAVTGSVYYTLKGSIQRTSSTTFTHESTFGHGFDGAGIPYQVIVFSDTVGSGNFSSTAYNLTISMTDTANSDTFTLVSGWVKQSSIG